MKKLQPDKYPASTLQVPDKYPTSTLQVPCKFRANNHVNPNELCFV